MRTTLTIDDDIAVALERVRNERNASLKAVVNEALRRGVTEMESVPKRRKPFRTAVYKGARLLIPIDNIAEAIALAEGEWHR